VPPANDAQRPQIFDRAKALDNLEGIEDLLKEIAAIFVTDYRDDLDAMHEAIATGDAEALFRLAHTLKGSTASFCAQAAFNATSVLVKQAREGRLEGINHQMAIVETLVEELATALRTELS
jgi:two-component system, sensor histidine kinase and response regulator